MISALCHEFAEEHRADLRSVPNAVCGLKLCFHAVYLRLNEGMVPARCGPSAV
jgi:hypothetical protein